MDCSSCLQVNIHGSYTTDLDRKWRGVRNKLVEAHNWHVRNVVLLESRMSRANVSSICSIFLSLAKTVLLISASISPNKKMCTHMHTSTSLHTHTPLHTQSNVRRRTSTQTRRRRQIETERRRQEQSWIVSVADSGGQGKKWKPCVSSPLPVRISIPASAVVHIISNSLFISFSIAVSRHRFISFVYEPCLSSMWDIVPLILAAPSTACVCVFRDIQCCEVSNEIQSQFQDTSCRCVRKGFEVHLLACLCLGGSTRASFAQDFLLPAAMVFASTLRDFELMDPFTSLCCLAFPLHLF